MPNETAKPSIVVSVKIVMFSTCEASALMWLICLVNVAMVENC